MSGTFAMPPIPPSDGERHTRDFSLLLKETMDEYEIPAWGWSDRQEDWLVNRELPYWPEHLRGIGHVLYKAEKDISDGYDNYIMPHDYLRACLIVIAQRLYNAAYGGLDQAMQAGKVDTLEARK